MKLALPLCVARMVQVPAATKVTVEPLTVQRGVVTEAKATGSPEVAVATRAKGTSPSVLVISAVNEIVCPRLFTVNERSTTGAAE